MQLAKLKMLHSDFDLAVPILPPPFFLGTDLSYFTASNVCIE
jgi:hypothetical protein